MTTAEKLRQQGRQQGHHEGSQDGSYKTMVALVCKAGKKGMSEKMIAQFEKT